MERLHRKPGDVEIVIYFLGSCFDALFPAFRKIKILTSICKRRLWERQGTYLRKIVPLKPGTIIKINWIRRLKGY